VLATAVVVPAPTVTAPTPTATTPQARPVVATAAPTPEVAAPVVQPALATMLETLPPSPSNPFRVLAIVGTGAQGTALVRTGPNQTTVSAAGTTTPLGQVVDVRRDGVAFVQNGRMRLLPIGE
jgi:cytoskeletal protein RodZ